MDDYKRAVQISPLTLFVPDLYDRIFTPGYVPSTEVEAINDGEVFFPTSDDEFDEMLAMWEAEEADADLQGVFRQQF